MVSDKCLVLLNQILAILDSAIQASRELQGRYKKGEMSAVMQLLRDLHSVVAAVSAAQEPLLPELEYAYTIEMLENVEDTLTDIQRSVQANDTAHAGVKMEFQLFPFLKQLKEAFYFWGAVYPDRERMDKYYQEEFAENYRNPYVGKETPIRLSIVVTGYNHLETTKHCVQQLLQETDLEKLHAELIFIDHGSTDGTLEYFESLGVGKVIHFKRNVRMYMFTTLAQVCQGQYFSFVSNDILVTRNWAEILLNCLESDEKVIAAVPATPNIANLQALGLPNLDPDGFVAWANKQNKANPIRWNDRVRLMPPLGMYRTAAVSQIGFADPYFYSMEFWDDDFSFRARRAGYRQVVCDDVACYHFGSVTGREGQIKEGTLVYGRELFLKKNGVDAWGNGFCYDYTTIQLFKQLPQPQGETVILGIDCGMGDTPLQLRNELRRESRDCTIYQLTCQAAYYKDIEPLSDRAVFSADLTGAVSSAFGGIEFSFACLGRRIEEYEDSEALLEAVAGRLSVGGTFIFFCDNPFYAVRFHALLGFTLPNSEARYVLADPTLIQRQAEQFFSQVQIISLEQKIEGLESFARMHYGQTDQLQQIIKRIGIEKYYFVCRK